MTLFNMDSRDIIVPNRFPPDRCYRIALSLHIKKKGSPPGLLVTMAYLKSRDNYIVNFSAKKVKLTKYFA